jgi:hypothetical protein
MHREFIIEAAQVGSIDTRGAGINKNKKRDSTGKYLGIFVLWRQEDTKGIALLLRRYDQVRSSSGISTHLGSP